MDDLDPAPDLDPTPDPTPFFSDYKDTKKDYFFHIFFLKTFKTVVNVTTVSNTVSNKSKTS
jgi:hypothetical protein